MYLLASKFRFFRVSFTIEPGRSLLQFVTTNCLMKGGNVFSYVEYKNERGRGPRCPPVFWSLKKGTRTFHFR